MKFAFNKTIKSQFVFLFVFIVALISLCYSGASYFLLHSAEKQLMGMSMENDLRGIYHYDIMQKLPPRVDQYSRLYIEGDPVRDIPPQYQSLPEGYSEYLNGEELHIFKQTLGGKVYILTTNQGDFENWERTVYLVGGIIFIALLGLAALLGWYFSKLMLNPISKLVKESEAMERDLMSGRIYAATAFAGSWGSNEVGVLARRLQMLTSRLRHVILNERQFISEVSHEMRTPLTIISTSLELLENSNKLDKGERTQLKRATDNTERMRKLIDVFLNLFKNRLNSEEDLKTLSEIIKDLYPGWQEISQQKGLTLVCDYSAKNNQRFNEVLASTVLSNLVGNALKFTEQGSVQIKIENNQIIISDTGPGILEEDRERIFQYGFRGNNAQGSSGYGLGLSIAKRCADALGWSIEITNQKEGGSVALITL